MLLCHQIQVCNKYRRISYQGNQGGVVRDHRGVCDDLQVCKSVDIFAAFITGEFLTCPNPTPRAAGTMFQTLTELDEENWPMADIKELYSIIAQLGKK